VPNAFNRVADRANAVLGSVWALILSVLVVVVWAATGPLFRFSDTWQLAINTGSGPPLAASIASARPAGPSLAVARAG
jgi:low affinity Fe/Cu permease